MTASAIGYRAHISGVVHAADPIYSPENYARVVFGDRRNEVVIGVDGSEMSFSVRKPVLVSSDTTVASLVDGLITGDDQNVTWNISLG